MNRLLERGVTQARYEREALRVRRVLPITSHLRWAKLRQLRPGHFAKALRRMGLMAHRGGTSGGQG